MEKIEAYKAHTIVEIDQALNFNEPVYPEHPFFYDLSNMRGQFRDKRLYRALNLDPRDLSYNIDANRFNKTLIFLAGMKGSGKTTELAKYAQNIDKKDAYFVITCNIDKELDMNHVEYMDILIFQLEKLIAKSQENELKIDDNILNKLQEWFEERIREINKSLKIESNLQVGSSLGNENSLFNILNLFANLRAGVTGTKERADSIRQVFKNRFSEFAGRFNDFVEEVAVKLRKEEKARDILFIIDGFEKTQTPEARKKILIDDATRISSIRANMLFTLPIELMSETHNIVNYVELLLFPFIKVRERNGNTVKKNIYKLIEFVYKRIDEKLFESENVVRKAVQYSGGSPRILIRILQNAGFELEDNDTKITMNALDKAINYLAAEARYLTAEELELLKTIRDNNEAGKETPFSQNMQRLLEHTIIMEYNDGNYKRVNPLIEHSGMYRSYVEE